jgi:O-antigen/teichoic acid export membrane protein
MTRSFRFHASNYAWAEVAATAAGLISFPILTRLLSVSDYGTMNLVATVLGLTVALGKLGVQHAALRSWAEVAAGRSGHSLATFEATVLWGMFATGLLVTLAWTAAAWSIPDAWWGHAGVGVVMLLAAPLIVVRVVDSALTNELRAQEHSGTLALYGTARRYAALVAVVGVLWWWSRDLRGLYLATLAVEALALAALVALTFRGRPLPRPSGFSRSLYGALALFGLPMLGSELSHVVLTMSDRFIVQTHLGAAELGLYAASQNMCDYLRNAVLGAMAAAAYPRCMRLWETEGSEGLQRFLGTFMHHYAVAALFMVALMSVAGGELMALLASAKFARGGEVTGWIMAGMAIQSALSVAAIGLYLAKRTLLALGLLLGAGVISIAANWLVVPWLGIRGAGITMLAVFALLGAAQLALARQTAPVVIPWRALATYGPVALLASGLAMQIHVDAAWLNLAARAAALMAVFVPALLLWDRALVAGLFELGRKRRAE